MEWSNLVDAIGKQFVWTETEWLECQLTKIMWTSMVEEYQAGFEEMALQTPSLSETFLTRCFLSGLRSISAQAHYDA